MNAMDAKVINARGKVVGTRRVELLPLPRPAPEPPREAPDAVWHILLTEPGQETTAAAGLIARRYAPYLPTFKRSERARGGAKRRVVERPLFPGYLFLLIDRAQADLRSARIRAIPGVRDWLMVGTSAECRAILSDREMVEVKKADARINRQKPKLPFDVGSKVEIDDPLWVGQLGTIEQLDDHGRVRVLIDLLGRKVPVHIDVGDLRSA